MMETNIGCTYIKMLKSNCPNVFSQFFPSKKYPTPILWIFLRSSIFAFPPAPNPSGTHSLQELVAKSISGRSTISREHFQAKLRRMDGWMDHGVDHQVDHQNGSFGAFFFFFLGLMFVIVCNSFTFFAWALACYV